MTYVVAALMVMAALAAIAWPIIRRDSADTALLNDEALERRIAGYRAALRTSTVCERCLRDNPANAKFCMECGHRMMQE